MLVRYYDSHDIWHFLSAFALFFTCWILLTLDDGIKTVPQGDIVDFHEERPLGCQERTSQEQTVSEESRRESEEGRLRESESIETQQTEN